MSVAALVDIAVEDVEYLRHASGPLLARIYRPKDASRAPRWCRCTAAAGRGSPGSPTR